MQIRIFTIPITDTGMLQEEMNKFLRGHKILEVQQELITNNKGSGYWCFCVRYIQGGIANNTSKKGKAKIDYKEGMVTRRLSKAHFTFISFHPTCFYHGVPKKYLTKNRAVIEGNNRVLRGGSWNNNAENCRVSNRNNNNPDNRNNNNGFRIAHSSRLGWMSAFEQVIVLLLLRTNSVDYCSISREIQRLSGSLFCCKTYFRN